MSGKDKPHSWEPLGSELHAQCKIFDIFRRRFHHPVRKSDKDFFVIQPPDWINMVAVTPEREVVAVRQFRFGVEEVTLEVPAGMMEPGEDPIETGIRELLEETGFAGDRAENLGSFYPNPAIQSNRCFIIAVHEARKVAQPDWDENEEIQVELIPLSQIPELLKRGAFTNVLSECALHRYLLHYSA